MGYISEVTNAKDVITLGSGSFDDGIFEFSFSATMNVYSSKSYERKKREDQDGILYGFLLRSLYDKKRQSALEQSICSCKILLL